MIGFDDKEEKDGKDVDSELYSRGHELVSLKKLILASVHVSAMVCGMLLVALCRLLTFC